MIVAAILWDGAGPLGGLAALLTAAIAAAIAVWLRPLSRRVVVAFGDLWARARASRGVSIPWREAIALALFGGALAAMALGVAGPRLTERPPRRIAIVLDASASMDARDAAGRRRFDLAKLAAARIARAAAPSDEVAILRVSASTRNVPAWELAAADVDDAAADFAGAAAAVASFLGTEADAEKRVVVLSDRAAAFPEVPGASVDRIPVGQPGENLAITSLGVSPGNASQGGLDALVVVQNHGASEASAEIVLHTDRFRVGTARVTIAPGATEARAFHLEGLPDPGRGSLAGKHVWASLDSIAFASGAPDALARDDRRAAFAPDTDVVKLALLSKGNRFLEGAIAALGGIAVRPLAEADVVLVDAGQPTPKLPARVRGVIRFGADGRKTVDAPVLSDWNGDHPVTRRVSLDDLTLASTKILERKDGDVVLAAVEQGPIALARESSSRREIVAGFDPSRSDFPLRLGFPVFVGSAVRWVSGEAAGETPDRGIAGAAVPIAAKGSIAARALPPGVRGDDARVVEQGGAPAMLASQSGLYEIVAGGRVLRVELGIDAGESALTVPGAVAADPVPPAWAGTDGEGADLPERELTSLLFAAGAVLLALKSVLA